MKAVMLEPGREARALDIPHTLKAMQQAVGGTIQAIYPWKGVSAALVCERTLSVIARSLDLGRYCLLYTSDAADE